MEGCGVVESRTSLDLVLTEIGMSSPELARRAGISRASVADWRAGRSQPRLDYAARIASVLGMPIDHVFFRHPPCKD